MADNIIKKYFTFDQFITATQKDLPKNHLEKYRQSSQDRDQDFTGTKSFDEATKLLKYGWPEGVKQLKTDLDNIKRATAPALEPFFDVAGEEPDIGRYLSGDPENMVEYHSVNDEGIKFLDIYICYAYNWTHSTKQIIRRGATILANIDSLEANGYRCRLIGYQSASFRKRRARKKTGLQVEVLLKDYDEPLELDRMAFALVNPSMYRRMGFKLDELYQPEMSNHCYGYGLNFDVPDGSLRIDRDTFNTDEINNIFSNHLSTE
jgi:hypothetical protein